MDCKEFSNLLDAYMDGTLPEAEARALEAHAEACGHCASLLRLRQDCRGMDEDVEVPDSFSSSWRRMIQEEANMEEKTTKKARNWKAYLAAAAAFVFLVGGTLLNRDAYPRTRTVSQSAASQNYDYNSAPNAALGARKTAATSSAYQLQAPAAGLMAEESMVFEDADVPYEAYEMEEAEADADAGRAEKIIRNASFTVKTTDYEQDLERLQALTADVGGRVEYLSASGDASSGQARSASLTLRIPAQQLDSFLDGAQTIGSVTALTEEMEDVSDSYYDIQTRLQTQKEKLSRLQAMIASADSVSDLIEIESAIADAQYYIDSYTGRLKSYDSKVDYSTVRVTVREVKPVEIQNISLGQRIWRGLDASLEDGLYFLEDMAVFLVSALPWLILIAAAALIIRAAVRRHKKKKNKEKE